VPELTRPTPEVDARKKKGRSRVSNGRDIFRNVDGRSMVVRRYRDICAAVLSDQGSDVSESRLQLIRRFAGIAVLAEETEAKLANGQPVDISDYSTLCSTLVRISTRIGLNRRALDVTPTVEEYVRHLAGNGVPQKET